MSDLGLGPLRGICCWCGLELYGDSDPVARIKAHLGECHKHPMRAVEAQRDELLAAADALLRGVSENGKLQPWLAKLGSAVNHIRAAVLTPKGREE